jgi:UDP-N-acetylmuramyl tripeptide synthase
VVEDLSPHTVLLGNLFRDQLDRYGELEKLADEWSALVAARAGRTSFVLNADDPLVADLGRDRDGALRERVTYFGLEDRSHALERIEHASDAKHCRRCGTAYTYSAAYLGHLGVYECPSCGNARPEPSVAARSVHLSGMAGAAFTLTSPAGEIEVKLQIPGLYNVYNATAAAACCLQTGVTLDQVERGLESFSASFGRAELIDLGDREAAILLVKNPAGANEVFRTLAGADGEGELDVWIVLNDRIADGRDISWIWDADFEVAAGRLRRVIVSGTRAADMALRLKYAEWDESTLEVVPQIAAALDRALAVTPPDECLTVIPTYTAMLSVRELLAGRAGKEPFWR